jgi:hypothetical protein
VPLRKDGEDLGPPATRPAFPRTGQHKPGLSRPTTPSNRNYNMAIFSQTKKMLALHWEKSRSIQWGCGSRRCEYKYKADQLVHVTHGTQSYLASVSAPTKQPSRCATRYRQPFWVYPYAPALLMRCQKPLGWNSMPGLEAESISLLPSPRGMSLRILKIA